MPADRYPQRIVCLTEETTETLYLLGEQDRIVGISGFTVRPPRARKEKPKVSAFLDADIEKIVALKPDLVIGFSDLQADIARRLIARGITVWVNNHRTIEGIRDMIARLGAMVGKSQKALNWIKNNNLYINELKTLSSTWRRRPKVYFEEWYDPLITAIQWVSEAVSIAGGAPLFVDKSRASLARHRVVSPADIVAQNPDIILASWCGKAFKKQKMLDREGWQSITAIQRGDVYEIDSSIVLQPGPAVLTAGLETLFGIFEDWSKKYGCHA